MHEYQISLETQIKTMQTGVDKFSAAGGVENDYIADLLAARMRVLQASLKVFKEREKDHDT